MADSGHIICFREKEAAVVIRDLAQLRLAIFEEYPYLYRGTLEDELGYLQGYVEAQDSLVLTMNLSGKVVGAATGMPLCLEGAELVDPVAASPYPVSELYYVGELLFYREFRNRGFGVRLLEQVELQVRSMGGYRYLVCATVVRPEGHPACPAGYLPIERFLKRTGFGPLDGIQTSFTWLETDGVKREHPMKFWIKNLG